MLTLSAPGLRPIEGVAEVQAVRCVRVNIRGGPVMLMGVDVAAVERRAKPPAIQGDAGSMYRRAARGEGALISEGFARLHGAVLNEVLEIPSPQGLLSMPVAGIVRDMSDQQGSIMISRDVYKREWNDDTVNLFRIYLQPGVDEAAVRQRILNAFGRTQRGLRHQIRQTIWMEAGGIGMIGTILGLSLGAVTLFYAVRIVRRLIGVQIDYAYPLRLVSFLIPLMLGSARCAAIGPAASAARGSLGEALE